MTFTRAVLAGLLLASGVTLASTGPAAAQTKTVAITAIAEHPALDAARDGIVEGLAAAGWKAGETVTIDFQSARGDPAAATQIARRFAGSRPDVIVPISTPSAQAIATATRAIPVVFTAVSDPVGARLVKSLEKPGGNVTGISDPVPVAAHVALIREILPNATRLAVLFSPGESNSVSLVRVLKEEAGRQGLSVIDTPVAKAVDAAAAVQGLAGKADALYIPLDNAVVSVLDGVVAAGRQAKLPVFSADTDSVARGTVASIGFDYRQVGRQAGAVAARILKGDEPGDIPVVPAQGTDLVINPASARAMGVIIPDAVAARATRVIGP